jgi:hypothetical protein
VKKVTALFIILVNKPKSSRDMGGPQTLSLMALRADRHHCICTALQMWAMPSLHHDDRHQKFVH